VVVVSEHSLGRGCSLVALTLLAISSSPAVSNAASIEEIAPGIVGQQWLDLAGDGSSAIVGTWGSAWKWTRSGGLSEIPLTGSGAAVLGISGDGSTAVGTNGTDTTRRGQATRWTASGAFPLEPGPSGQGWAYAASGDGSVIVGASAGTSNGPAFRWTQATGMVGIGANGPAYDVSADGSVVVGISDSLAFRWTADQGVLTLPTLPPTTPQQRITYSEANAASADGSWVVGETNGQAFRWSEASGMVGLGVLPPFQLIGIPGTEFSFATDVSGDGSVVVGATGAFDPLEEIPFTDGGFVWTATGGTQRPQDFLDERGIDLTGWILGPVFGVSDDGTTMLGVGQHDGRSVVWIAAVPEPSTTVLLALGFAGLAAIRRAGIRYHPRVEAGAVVCRSEQR
jgi:uncharacterized membrane protein